MALVRWKNRDLDDPWSNLKTLQDEINDLFDFDRFPTTSSGLFDRNFSPAIDVVEGEQDFTVICELPNINEKDLDIQVASNVLTIKGHKNEEREDKKSKYFKKESWSGSFQRTLPLPSSIDAEKIKAKMKNGVLTITVPKKEEAIPKKISVSVK